MLLQELLNQVRGVTLVGSANVQIRGVTYDSRRVTEGILFVAMKGEKTDGALFAADAIARGAAAVASDHGIALKTDLPILYVPDARRFLAEASRAVFGDPAARMKLVAITGTNGKTTTSYLLNAIFHEAGLRPCVVGTLGMRIGDDPFPAPTRRRRPATWRHSSIRPQGPAARTDRWRFLRMPCRSSASMARIFLWACSPT